MASLMESVIGALGSGGLREMSSRLGVDEATTGKAVAAALPLILSGLARNASQKPGAESLSAALEQDHDGSLLDTIGGFLGGALGGGRQTDGAGILKHVFGAVQPRVEAGVSRSSGLDAGQAGKVLAMLAPVVMSALGRAKREKNMDAASLANYLGGERQAIEQKTGQNLGILNQLLDADGDGDVDLSDLASRGASLFGKFLGGR